MTIMTTELLDEKSKIVEAFRKLNFIEETHQYYVHGEPLQYSVSGLVSKFSIKPDFDRIAQAIDKRDSLPIGSTSRLWKYDSDVSCAVGTKTHFYGELLFHNSSMLPSTGYEEALRAFWDSIPEHLVPVFTEIQMYHFVHLFGGTADLLFYNTKTKKFVIADYKTNKDLFKNHKEQTLLAPFDFLLDTPFNKYQIQFNLYQILLEQVGIEIEDRLLVHLKPNGEYEMYSIKDYTSIIKPILEHLC